MTWKELKEKLDKELEDDDEIWFIDLTFPSELDFKHGVIHA
jgi:hypothetical protein